MKINTTKIDDNVISNIQKIKTDYLIKQAKDLISYFRSKKIRWTEMLELEINKIITFRTSMIEMQQILHNDNLNNMVKNIDKYLIDLEYLKKYDDKIDLPTLIQTKNTKLF